MISNAALPAGALRAIQEMLRRRASSRAKFGAVEPPPSATVGGQRLVVVDGKIKIFSANYTYHDFLAHYVVERLGTEWFEVQSKQDFEHRHPIAQWHEKMTRFHDRHRRSGGRYSVEIEGVVGHLLTLAHDLFTLSHVGLLEKRLVERLLHKDQFQGARYELQVAAICLRAGYQVDVEDESDVRSTHCDFVIRSRATGRSFSVEAKSRHRRGVLGRDGHSRAKETFRPDVGHLLEDALGKAAIYERIVFIDLNLPPVDGSLRDSQLLDQVTRLIEGLEAKQTELFKFPAAVLVFTNRPDHYVADDAPAPPNSFMMTGINIPAFRASQCGADGFVAGIKRDWPEVLALHQALSNQASVPENFEWQTD